MTGCYWGFVTPFLPFSSADILAIQHDTCIQTRCRRRGRVHRPQCGVAFFVNSGRLGSNKSLDIKAGSINDRRATSKRNLHIYSQEIDAQRHQNSPPPPTPINYVRRVFVAIELIGLSALWASLCIPIWYADVHRLVSVLRETNGECLRAICASTLLPMLETEIRRNWLMIGQP